MRARRWLEHALAAVLIAIGGGLARGADPAGQVPAAPTPEIPGSNAPFTSAGVEREYKGKLDPIGPFLLSDLNGKPWTDEDLRGKVVIAVQWAVWCGPCVSGLPQVQKLYDSLRKNESMRVVTLDMDKEPFAISEFFPEFRAEYSFPVLLAGSRFRMKAVPTTWIVDPEGYIREVLRGEGPGWDEQVLALALAVKHGVPVSALPPQVRKEQQNQNRRDAENTR